MMGIKSTKKRKEKTTHTHTHETKSVDEAIQRVSVPGEWLGLGENGGRKNYSTSNHREEG